MPVVVDRRTAGVARVRGRVGLDQPLRDAAHDPRRDRALEPVRAADQEQLVARPRRRAGVDVLPERRGAGRRAGDADEREVVLRVAHHHLAGPRAALALHVHVVVLDRVRDDVVRRDEVSVAVLAPGGEAGAEPAVGGLDREDALQRARGERCDAGVLLLQPPRGRVHLASERNVPVAEHRELVCDARLERLHLRAVVVRLRIREHRDCERAERGCSDEDPEERDRAQASAPVLVVAHTHPTSRPGGAAAASLVRGTGGVASRRRRWRWACRGGSRRRSGARPRAAPAARPRPGRRRGAAARRPRSWRAGRAPA